jgi:hypothetical protein
VCGLRIPFPVDGRRASRRFVDCGRLTLSGDDIADDVGDALFDAARSGRQFLIVERSTVRIAQYAASMIYESQRLFDIALPVAGFRVILANLPT